MGFALPHCALPSMGVHSAIQRQRFWVLFWVLLQPVEDNVTVRLLALCALCILVCNFGATPNFQMSSRYSNYSVIVKTQSSALPSYPVLNTTTDLVWRTVICHPPPYHRAIQSHSPVMNTTTGYSKLLPSYEYHNRS